MLGFDAIMKIQKWLTIAMIVATGVYVALTVDHIDLDAAQALPDGPTTAVIGATVLVLTGFGVGWVNSAADYSRYLPRTVRTPGVVFWPTFGGSLPGRDPGLATACCSARTTPTSPPPSPPTRSAR